MSENTNKRLPLTQAQRRVWNMEMMYPNTAVGIIAGTFIIRGHLQLDVLLQSIYKLIKEHDAFRIRIASSEDDQPIQWFEEETNIIPECDCLQFESPEEAKEWLERFNKVPISIFDEKLYHFCVFQINDEEHWLNLKINHMIADGFSSILTLNSIMQNYTDLMNGTAPDLQVKSSYFDYIYAEQQYEGSERYNKDKAYWLDKFASFSEITTMKPNIPYDISTEAKRTTVVAIPPQLYEQLRSFTEQHNVGIFTIFLASLYILFYKVTGNQDITVGTLYANRTSKQEKETLGMFASTVAMRVLLDPDQSAATFLSQVSREQRSYLRHQKYPYNQLIQDLRKENKQHDIQDLFRVDIDYLPVTWTQYDNLSVLQNVGFCGHEAVDFAIQVWDIIDEQQIELNIDYRIQLFEEHEILRIAKQMTCIIEQMIQNPHQTVRELSILSEEEKNNILTRFNPVSNELPPEKTFHRLFEEQAERTPEATAVVYEDKQLTYRELNERSNRLADTLRRGGIGRESIVGILADRSVDLLVGVMAVWKAGGAYVPLDPDYPSERIRFMLEDSGAKVLLTQTHLRERSQAWLKDDLTLQTVLCLDEEESYGENGANVPDGSAPGDLSYVIYTSGTTGRPKGVMIEHRSLVNTAAAYRREYRLDQFPVRLLQLASFSFDVFVGDIARTLYNGGTMVICPKDDRIDPVRLYGWIRDKQITIFESTPALIVPFMDYVAEQGLDMSSMELLITSSDSCSVADYRLLQERFGSQFRIINAYGVTEAAIDSSFYDEPLAMLPEAGNVPIGKAWLNARFYIVDAQLKPVPVGVLGELCIGGPGVARGYWNRPELNEEKFVDSPFVPGERLYRTGDLARWMEDGNVDFIGRIDYQVKIRGYRIELGEIESAMLRFAGVRQAVVKDWTDERGQKYLCGYAVAEQELHLDELQSYLDQALPAHMVPARLVCLEQLPLTPNGKVDRKALPEPEGNVQAGASYLEPRTEAEKALVSVWQAVLGVDRIGILDNFFALGGDSIKALQVSSRVLQAGYKLVMRDLFHHPTIAALSPHLQAAGKIASQEEVTGDVALTPIQRWFFEQNPADLHHSNQSFMQYRQQGFDEAALRQTMKKIVEHHDALRTVYRKTETGVYAAWNRGIDEGELYSLEVVDLTGTEDCAAAIEAKANEIQGSIDLENGPLVKLGLFRCADGDHLLIAIHHLVVDGVSWRILFEDLATGYEQALSGQAIRFPHKTDSFRTWAEQLSLHANSPAMQSERTYWQGIEQAGNVPLPKDYEQGKSLLQDSDVVTVRWTAQETEQLLKQAHRAYNTEMNDLLLTALGMAVRQWTGLDRVLVNLEGHGREDIVKDVDITRTVGWFTSQFPIALETGQHHTVSQQIKQVKEGLRRIPNKGIGYGILRYLSAPQEGERFVLEPEISFNYLGQFDQDYESNGMKPSPYSTGSDVSRNATMDFALDMNGMVTEGALELTIRYGTTQYRRETVERLGALLQSSLREVIAHCLEKERPELTPSDVQLKGLTLEELGQLTEQTEPIGELENVYALTPMQMGMLFHNLMDAQSGAYFEQVMFDLQGAFDIEAFSRSLDLLVQRHEALRTNFVSGWKDKPVQVVFRKRDAEIYYEDVSGMPEAERAKYVADFTALDKAKGFDLAQGSLMRMAVLRTGEQSHHVIWSHHHILMDGWCMFLMLKEVFDSYFAFIEQKQPALAPVTPFAQFIEWLEKQDLEAPSSYWSGYLADYEQQALLPQEGQHKQEGYLLEELDFEFSQELYERVEEAAKQNQVTVNTLLQTVWGVMLQAYNNSPDVVFGCVVSGRPADIPGVENMIGLFINTIPVRIQSAAGESFADVMRRTQEQALASGVHDTFPLYEIQALSELKRDLINHIMVFENYPMEQRIEQLVSGGIEALAISNIQAPEQTNYDFVVTVIPDERMLLRFSYNALKFTEAGVQRLFGHLVRIIEQIVDNPNTRVDELELVTPQEKEQFLNWSGENADYPREKLIHQLFEEQVERTPDAVAVIGEHEELTYGELNKRVNRLARTLRAKGVQPDQKVGVMAERSLEMMVAILAILKSGGAYVPIDPTFPEERIRYMLEDSEAKLLLTQGHLLERAPFAGHIVNLDDAGVYSEDDTNPELVNDAENAAYVIYTSGTTGRPKGVVVEHRSVINRLLWMQKNYPIDAADTIMQKTAITFDVSVWELFWWAFAGSKVCLLSVGGEKNPAVILETIARQRITTMHFVPSMLHAFLEYAEQLPAAELESKLTSLRYVFASGEALTVSQVARFHRYIAPVNGARIINLYGPTEATVDVSYFNCEEGQEYASVPIGKPIDNTQLYIVSRYDQLQPIGVPGELCIAGDGLARGYLNRPELTAEKFVAIPFMEEGRMYRTGDLARWLPDGNIEYMGRIDHQVKIRGYRIEIGEIETQILKVAGVREAVVVAREDESGKKELCAYFAADRKLTVSEWREALSQELPGYMIPTYFVQLEKLPLSANGKIDRKALPAPEGSVQTGAQYVAPRTVVEQTLASVWEGVLGAPRVGIRDNFFDLGGDSIKSIQVSSRLFQAGYKLEMKDLFKYPTISELSPHIQTVTRIAEQGEVTGATKLMPIQHWFLERQTTAPHHFNQAVMLYREEGFEETALRTSMTKLAEHHDALRLVLRRTEHGIEAWNRGVNEGELYSLDVFDFTGEADCAAAVEAKANEIQSGIDLNEGPLMKLGLFRCADGDHLLIVIHHFAVDGVSWRILFEDFAAGYEQAVGGQAIQLPQKTDSFQLWAHKLSLYAESAAMDRERAYWREIAAVDALPLPKDQVQACSLFGDAETVTVQWSEQETEQLLKQAHRAYNTEMNDLLLTALGMAIHEWSGIGEVLVNLEGHGREPIVPDIDITRTVGWFTSQYPIVLDMGADREISRRIKRVKEGLRQIPHKGIGYGILNYLSASTEGSAWNIEPEISFNYMGQFDQDLQSNALRLSPYSIGEALSAHTVQSYALDINGMISEGALELSIRYNGKEYRKETIERLAGMIRASLQEVILHCVTKDRAELTPSDVLLKGLTMEQLEQLVEQTWQIGDIENVYKLTSMQKGMMFHSLMEPKSAAYFEQAEFGLQGRLDTEAFAQSFDALAQRHAILRTNFYNVWADLPVQVVYRHKRVEFAYQDLRGMNEAERQAYLETYAAEDKARGFDLATDSLMRVAVLHTAEESYRVLWSFHHIIMDGWCIPLITGELFEHYSAICAQRQPELIEAQPYSRYIEWLEQQDDDAASNYWSRYLEGYEHQTTLPEARLQGKTEAYVQEELNCDWGKDLTRRIDLLAKRYQVTVNTLLQTAWGVALQSYNGQQDVVFGSVVSGRPAEIPGIESMIGLFINTIPVRVQTADGETFAEVVTRIQQDSLASHAYDTYPLYEIQGKTEQKHDLINHIMVFENYPVEQQVEETGSGVDETLELTDFAIFEQTNYDFNLIVIPGDALRIIFRYNASVYERASVERIRGHLLRIIEQIADNPNIRVDELELITPQEKEQLLNWSGENADYPRGKLIHQLFEEQVERTPDAVAVIGEHEELTYGELNKRVNRLARTLRAKGVQPDQTVGVMAERSLEMMVAILAILKSGGAYVPIDPTFPEERIRYMLEDSEAKLLLAQGHLLECAPFAGHIVNLDDAAVYSEDDTNPELVNGAENAAYVIYTSGTTGRPKGVVVEHRSVINRLLWMQKNYPIDATDTIMQKTAITFDVSVWELFWWAFAGSKVCLLSVGGEKNPAVILETIARQKITTMHFVPSMLHAFLEYVEQLPAAELESKLTSLRYVFASGEALTVSQVARFHRYIAPVNGARIINLYGPTEATVDVSYFNCEEGQEYASVPIGKPIDNTQLYIVSRYDQLQPIGVPGELCIAGDGLARGYLNRPELTAEKFVSIPFMEEGRMYRTGDLARWLPDGNIEYMGRIDHQVKIRGYRIEIGEIETQILKVAGVREAVVVAREDESGKKELCAYFAADRKLTVGEWREALSQELPGYMIPTYFVQLEKLPLSANGKIDRKALPAPEGSVQTWAQYVAPRTLLEARLARIWKEVLGVSTVGVKDNFFELGGHSLRATTMVNKLHKEMNVDFPLRDVFRYPTIEAMARAVAGMEEGTFTAIPVVEEREHYPVSSAQKRLFILHQLEGAELSYNMPGAMLLEGALDRSRFEEAFRGLIARHETLRTGFEMANGEPVQRVYREVDFAVDYVQAGEEEASEVVRNFVRAFDLAKPPLLRIGLIGLAEERHILIFDMHHIISDGVSMDVLVEEFVRLYGGEELEPLRIQYKDYAVWQQSEAQQEQLKHQEAYWLNKFQGELPVLEMPTDFARPAVQSYKGDTLQFFIDAQKREGLQRIAAETGATLYMVMLAAYTVLLHKYTGQEDIIVGTPIAGRTHENLQPLIGMFVNTLAIRNFPAGEKTFLSYLDEVRETTLGAYEHQDYPYEELINNLQVARDLSRNPLFDTMIVMQSMEDESFNLQGLRLAPYPIQSGISKFDLSLDISEVSGGLEFSFEFATALYKRETIERLAKHFEQLLAAIINDPGMQIGKLAMLTSGEKEQVQYAFNTTAADYPREKLIHQLFEEQVERTPDAVAVIGKHEELTYGELNKRVNRLARTLRAKGVQPDQKIGVMAERSLEMMVAILAILKSGGAYVPIDPTFPEERIRYMLEDSEAKLLLTQGHLLERAPFAGHIVNLDDAAVYSEDDTNPELVNDAENAAYVIYTSGTTGRPKGVVVEHRSVINRLLWMQKNYPIDAADTIMQKTAITFDVSVWELFWWAFAGSKLCLLSVGGEKNPAVILETIARQRITTMHFVPSMLHAFLEYVEQLPAAELESKLTSLRYVFASGEALTVSQVARFHRYIAPVNGARIINLYGPTEATVDVSYFNCEEGQEYASVPIGKPIDNTQLYIVSRYDQLQPIGVPGELCIAGDGLARGYLNRPELTAEKFVAIPFMEDGRMYRTGDLARWLPDGNIEYMGRIDHQVKIRGYRIEIGEIETQILKVAGVRETVVIAREDESGKKELCAYFAADRKLTVSEWREALSQELPGYMIPTYFVQLEKLPLSANGKIDRKALPAPEGSVQTGAQYVAPRTLLEARLARIWKEVLGVSTVGVKDNFFELGGHSLRATTLVNKLHKEMNVDFPLRDVFRYMTIEEMAQAIERMEERLYVSIPTIAEQEHYPVSSAQKRLFILHQLEGAELSYNMPGAMLLEGALDRSRFEEAFRRLIARHETLRTGFEMANGEPVQRVYREVDFAVDYVQAGEEEASEVVRNFVRAFDLAKPPLLRIGLIGLAEERHILIFDMHHIISDGVSMDVLVEEFVRLYGGEELEPLRIQYKDYAVWQQSEAHQEQLKHQEAYWLDVFQEELPVLEMPTDYVRPAVRKFDGSTLPFRLNGQLGEELKRIAAESEATLYMVLLAAYTILLQKYTSQEDIIVGTPIAGRTHGDLQPLIGMFVNTLAIRSYPNREKTFRSYLQEVKETMLGAYEHQSYPFEELVEKLQVNRDLSRNSIFDAMFVLQHTENEEIQMEGLHLTPYPYQNEIARFDLTLDVSESSDGLECRLEYATALYRRETIERMAKHFEQLLVEITAAPEAPLASLNMLSSGEMELLHRVFNGTEAEYASKQTIHGLFEEQVERTPDHVAVVFEGRQLTYRELNDRANRLARTLRAEGVQAEQPVGLMLRRSIEMVVGLFAVLKAGGAYVPIDPEYPEERIRYMLEDSGAQLLLTQRRLKEQVPFAGKVIVLDDEEAYSGEGSNLASVTGPDHVAYVIYTSGTTGKPKGVMVEHRGLCSLKLLFADTLQITNEDRIVQFASLSFDASCWEIFQALFLGAALYIPSAETIQDHRLFESFVSDHGITTATLPPTYATYLNPDHIPSLRRLVTAGSAASMELIQQWKDKVKYFNAYGPTEDSICTSIWTASENDSSASVSIGRPIQNHRIYIVDPGNQLLPVGVAGELCIAGAGLARGYLNRPELTAEKFVDNPFVPGERMYRTGDLARWLPDGNIEYLGRIDHQVKIRGYRIELGEIEGQLLKVESVQEAIVLALDDANRQKQLCAYYVADQELAAGELRAALSQELPGYMIPSHFVPLERMPLTPNGKIDRKALPAPESAMHTRTEYVAPQTDKEKALAAVWQAVLGEERIGVTDHFFELGGDSIKAIQVSSRLHQAGYKLEIRDLFKYPSIAQLSLHIQQVGRTADQGEVTGEAVLTPIQRWFFEQPLDDPHHFNQSVMLYQKEGFDEAAIRKVLQKITEHHDALRIVFRRSDNGYTAWNRAIEEGEPYSLEVADFRGIEAVAQAIEAKSNEIQSGIDLEAGPLVKAGLFHCADGDHLLIVIHHGVVDGVSWRIILEDFALGYEQAVKGEAIRLPAKTDAFRTWSEQIAAYGRSTVIENERAYWQRITQTAVSPLPKDMPTAKSLQCDSDFVTVQWSRRETEQLLKGVHRAYNTEINDILLTALGLALQRWCSHDRVLVNLEGHGRESIMTDIDITRTVGWFTSKYPVVLELEPGKVLSYQIKKVKESLRQIPNKGIGYGVCRYMSEHTGEVFRGAEPEISFNYLGQFDQELQNSGVGISAHTGGKPVSDRQARNFVLDINGMISDGVLSLELSYSRKEYRRETIGKLAAWLQDSLREIVDHCTVKARAELTPSDVQFKGLSIAELEQIEERTRHIGEIENIYTLTPMQKGMWFHNTLNRHGGAYIEQALFVLQGDLNIELFVRSWNDLAARHMVLRTNFYNGWSGDLLQIVYRDKQIEFTYEELSHLQEHEWSTCIDKLVDDDKTRGFDLEQDALMRVKVIRTKEERYHVLWTFHHILMDGWCLPLIAKELFDTYGAYMRNEQPERPDAPLYSQFIEWLEKQDKEAASRYWSEYLAGYEGQTTLPLGKVQQRSDRYAGDNVLRNLGKSLSKRINQVANQYKVTVNTLLQTAWGVILQKYNGTGDAVFGSVVSGRPAEIPGIEEMIGLFINTIPVRVACEAETSFDDAMRRLQESALESGRHDYYPLYEIQAQTAQKQDLISHIMAFENYPLGEQLEQAGDSEDETLAITDVAIEEQTNYDFALVVMPGEELVIRFDYNTLTFERCDVERLMGHLVHVLEQIVANPRIAVGDLELATAEERTELIERFNAAPTEFPREKTLHQLFEEQAERIPDAVAVVFEDEQWTYRELNERANRLARTLRAGGVDKERAVGIMAERSLEMIVGILATMKAGGAYVPIDPEYPEERIRYMIEDSGAQMLLTQRHLQERIPVQGTLIVLDDEASYHPDGSKVEPTNGAANLAFIIYTSGTTGKPKGNLVEHRNVVRIVRNTNYIDITDQDRVLQMSSYSFDGSVFDIFGALTNGARLVLIPRETMLDIGKLAELIERQQISVALITTALFNVIVDVNVDCLRRMRAILFGGERVSVSHVRKALQHIGPGKIIHAYGPSESTVYATYYTVNEVAEDAVNVPIGWPLSNTTVYIVDGKNKLQPIGVAGELCIAGEGLVRGYLNRPELTAEKFVDNPFVPGERMYRTGDLARWLPDGTIEYVGRIDDQVKIRGYRIELGEVEAQLARVGAVQEAVVIARGDASGQQQLCAYFVAQSELSAAELRQALSQELPGYMIPAHFIQLPQLPLTPNGKVDRKALPAPEASAMGEAEYVAPRSLLETKLVQIWQDVLGLERIGVKDNFFELGGNSISLIRLIQRIHDESGVDIPLHKGYEYTSVEAMANANWESGFEKDANQFVKLNQQGEMNVFCFPPGPGFGIAYQGLAEKLENRFAVYSIDFIDDSPSYEDMIDCYVDEVVRVQKQEPYVFIGYCIGGNMMFEVAKAMEKRGYRVSDLIMVDSLVKLTPKSADMVESNIEESMKFLMETEKILTENSSIRERVEHKVRSNLTYEAQLINTGHVLANIHDLIAEDTEAHRLENPSLLWKGATRQNYTKHKLTGDHDHLLRPEYIEATASVIQRILDQIKAQNAQAQTVPQES